MTTKKSSRDLSTPEIPISQAVFTTYASTRINAPAALVFRTIRNVETWKDWNNFIPKVEITYQPPDEDNATMAEVNELVRNTSIAGSVDSDITDGAISMPSPNRKLSNSPPPGFIAPPVTRQRLASNASRFSSDSGRPSFSSGSNPPGSPTLTVPGLNDAGSRRPSSVVSTGGKTNGKEPSSPPMSGAAKFIAATNSRKASIASGKEPEPVVNNVLVESPHDPSLLMPAPPNTGATNTAVAAQQRRRSSVSSAQKRAMSINAIYGEPSVRIQLGTKMTFHCRMKIPSSYVLDKEINVVVTEVSRPDDIDEGGFGIGRGGEFGPIERTKTHTQSRSGVYRLVWSMVNSTAPPKPMPKFMLQTQRVIEIRSVIRGDGKEECVYEDWESQKGMMAKGIKKQYEDYLQKRFEMWGKGLGAFCESLGGDVERRDFVE